MERMISAAAASSLGAAGEPMAKKERAKAVTSSDVPMTPAVAAVT